MGKKSLEVSGDSTVNSMQGSFRKQEAEFVETLKRPVREGSPKFGLDLVLDLMASNEISHH
jgi:hypothetical protein